MKSILEGHTVRRPRYASVKNGVATLLDETGREVGSMSEETYRAVVAKFEKQLIEDEKKNEHHAGNRERRRA